MRLRRALNVLNRHGIRQVKQLTLPHGGWLPFVDTPVPAWDSGWYAGDYAVLCKHVGMVVPREQRTREVLGTVGGQQTISFPVVPAPPPPNPPKNPTLFPTSAKKNHQKRAAEEENDPFRPKRTKKWNKNGPKRALLSRIDRVL